jgi:hypothetical protein
MFDRQNTVVCGFDSASPKITAHNIHEWIFTKLKIPEHQIIALQVDVIKRQVFIKFHNKEYVEDILRNTGGQVGYKYPNGERFQVSIAMAGLGKKKYE